MCGPVSVVQVHGPLDEAAAASILEFAAAAAGSCQAVQVDIDEAESLSTEATALLLFPDEKRTRPGPKIVLRAASGAGQRAVLRAYARRRGRPQP